MRIMFHADDLGATENVNSNILAAWHANALDSVSVLANGSALESAATAVNSDPSKPLRLIVHLNLSEGPPIAAPESVPKLLNTEGHLRYGFVGLWKTWLRSSQHDKQELLEQIELEWRLQIKRVIDTFKPSQVSGIDGHIHVHMLPFLFPLAVRLSHEAGLNEVRISDEINHFSLQESMNLGFCVNTIKHTLLRILSKSARKHADKYNMSSPDKIAGILYSGNMTKNTTDAAIIAAKHANLQWLEVLFHPGRASPNDVARWKGSEEISQFYLSDNRDMERDALISMGDRRDVNS